VVEDRYSRVFKLDWVRPALVADGLAELQVRWSGVPIIFAESRPLAEEWVYRYLAAAQVWAGDELALAERLGQDAVQLETVTAPAAPEPATSEVRAWARWPDSPSPIADACGPTSGRPGTQPTRQPERTLDGLAALTSAEHPKEHVRQLLGLIENVAGVTA
jgi:hypothetical protein